MFCNPTCLLHSTLLMLRSAPAGRVRLPSRHDKLPPIVGCAFVTVCTLLFVALQKWESDEDQTEQFQSGGCNLNLFDEDQTEQFQSVVVI